MHAFGRKLGLICALSMAAFAGGCKGFFVNPTLTTIAVGPTASIAQTRTVQMVATGTFSDGTTSTSVSGLFWSSSDQGVATVSSNGLVTGVAPGTATITAAAGSVTGSAMITVTLGNITMIQISDTQTNSITSATISSGGSVQFKAEGTTSGGQTADVTQTVNWAVTNSVSGVSISPGGSLTTTSGNDGTVIVQATDPSSGTASQQFTVNIVN